MPVALSSFVGQFVTDWNLIFAALVISIVPILAVYFALLVVAFTMYGMIHAVGSLVG